MDEGVFPLDEGTFPLDEGVFPLDEGTFPLDEGTFPLDEGAFPLDEGKNKSPFKAFLGRFQVVLLHWYQCEADYCKTPPMLSKSRLTS